MLRIDGSNIKRLISSFLIVFGIVGYVACVPLTFLSNSVLSIFPSSLNNIQINLNDMKGMVSEAEIILIEFNSGLDGIILAISVFDFTIGVDTFNSSFESIQEMLNETVNVVDSVEQTLDDNANWLDSLANNSWIQLVAPDVATEAGVLAMSMRSTIEMLNGLLIEPTIESLTELQPYVTVLLTQFENVSNEIQSQLQMYKTYVESARIRLENIKTSIESWISNIQNIRDKIWIINVALYGFVVYIVLIHTAFLLTGLSLRSIIG